MGVVKQAIDFLVLSYSPSADAAWTAIREMHKLGYELNTHADFDIAFTGAGNMIIPVVRNNTVLWATVQPMLIRRDLSRMVLTGEHLTTLADPVSVAVWWDIEKSNASAPSMPTWDDSQPSGNPWVNPFGTPPTGVQSPGPLQKVPGHELVTPGELETFRRATDALQAKTWGEQDGS